ncbi:hypothetical protein KJZ63_04485 [Patescibacteria group bacterium]|nr:hypothetical protein [Patescibacteria group bacterium]
MKIVKFVFFALIFFVFSVSTVNANRCCPDGMTRCDGIGNDMIACVSDGHRNAVGQGSDEWCGRTTYQYGVLVKERYTSPSFECDAEGNPVTSALSCEWTPLNNAESEYNGRPAYCVGGFASEAELQNSNVTFSCVDNCGGVLAQLANRLGNGGIQQAPTGGAAVGVGDDGTYYTCFTGDFDNSIKSSIESCLQDKGIATAVGGGTGFILGALVPGPNVITVPVLAVGGATLARSVMGDCEPTIRATTRGYDLTCSADLRIDLNLDTEAGNLEASAHDWLICDQILDPTQKQACKSCYDGDDDQKNIWTAVGCIDNKPTNIISTIVNVFIGLVGGVSLLRILAASVIFVTSQGDVKKVTEAKEMISSSVVGIIVVIFSVTILQFIGSGILKIPGFG